MRRWGLERPGLWDLPRPHGLILYHHHRGGQLRSVVSEEARGSRGLSQPCMVGPPFWCQLLRSLLPFRPGLGVLRQSAHLG